MVDSQFAPLSQKIAAAIHQISDKPIRFLVDTHVHGDHTGGNENFAKMGATIFARDELRWRLAHPSPGANGAPGVAAPADALPVVTYEGPVTIHMRMAKDVHLIPIHRAHTDGDTRWCISQTTDDAHDRRLFPLDPISEYRSSQWRIVGRNDRRAGHHDWHGWSPTPRSFWPRRYCGSSGVDCASRHDPGGPRQSCRIGGNKAKASMKYWLLNPHPITIRLSPTLPPLPSALFANCTRS